MTLLLPQCLVSSLPIVIPNVSFTKVVAWAISHSVLHLSQKSTEPPSAPILCTLLWSLVSEVFPAFWAPSSFQIQQVLLLLLVTKPPAMAWGVGGISGAHLENSVPGFFLSHIHLPSLSDLDLCAPFIWPHSHCEVWCLDVRTYPSVSILL